MFDMTPAASRAWQFASQMATAAGCRYVEPRHLLHGLLHDEDGRPWQLLARAGANPADIASRAQTTKLDTAIEPLAPSLESGEVLARARELCRTFGEESSVSTDHLLVGLVQADENTRQLLVKFGLELEALETAAEFIQGPPILLQEPLHLQESVDLMPAFRILDASANRAREALRVLEDYTRFVLDDRFLCGQLKDLRHDLASVVQTLPLESLLQARDTEGDVGTAITGSGEMDRASILDVVLAGTKRLEESLRSLEEYGKLVSAEIGAKFEALRYRSYTLERAIAPVGGALQRLGDANLYVLVSSETCKTSVVGAARAAVEGGAGIIQLREKKSADREFLALAREVRRVTRQAGALFIVNDRPDLARLCDADGVHVGQDDLPVREVRRIAGPHLIVGVSTHTIEQLRQAELDGASYVGVGPTFASTTKDFGSVAGLEFVMAAMAETSLPAFAIGGITAGKVAALLAAGARRIAVSAAVCGAADPCTASAELIRALRRQG